jgi:hypothetical protein
VTAWWRLADGRDVGVDLTADSAGFHAVLPPALTTAPVSATQPARLFALTIAESTGYATREQHHIGEGLTSLGVLGGRVLLASPTYSGVRGLSRLPGAGWTGWGATSASDSVSAQPGASGLAVTYAFTGDRLVLRADATAPETDVPVLVDASTAARAVGGRLQLGLSGGPPVTARVVGVLPQLPTVGDSFVLADESVLAQRLDSREPGTGAVTELWLSTPEPSAGALAAALGGPPYDRLGVDLQAVQQARLAADPLARGAAALLVVGALLAVAVEAGDAVGGSRHLLAKLLGFAALIMASVNIFGGFLVTQRMLGMYQKKKK